MSESQEIDLAQLNKMVRVNRKVINRLKERVSILENALELVCEDEQMRWLYANREERMDPFIPIFRESRAQFHLARYEFACQFVSGKMVTDIACGTGYGSRVLKEQGHASRVVGVDIDAKAVEYAAHRHGVDGIEFHQADAMATGLAPESCDVVVSFETIEHVQDDQKLIDEFHRILKSGGKLICSTPNAWPLEIAEYHVREYDRQSFVAALSTGFSVKQLFNQNSGTDFQYNHGQPVGIVETTDENHELAECFIAVAYKS